MAISHEDREWFKEVVNEAVKQREDRCKQIADDAIKQHNKDAISHNVVKSAGLFASITVVYEFVKSLLKH